MEDAYDDQLYFYSDKWFYIVYQWAASDVLFERVGFYRRAAMDIDGRWIIINVNEQGI